MAVRTGGQLAVAFRKDYAAAARGRQPVAPEARQGRRVPQRHRAPLPQGRCKYVKNAAAEAERRKLQATIELFKKYGAQYDLDYLLMAAQGYQESTLDQDVRSKVGAIGVMQVMPPTAKELNVGDICQVEPNIHAGVKYMRFMMDTLLQGRADGPAQQGR